MRGISNRGAIVRMSLLVLWLGFTNFSTVAGENQDDSAVAKERVKAAKREAKEEAKENVKTAKHNAKERRKTANLNWKEKNKRSQELISEAEDLEKDGKLADARAKYEESISVFSTLRARKHLSSVTGMMADELTASASKSFEATDFKQAIVDLKKADVLRPNHEETLYNLAVCHFKTGDRKTALEYLARYGSKSGLDASQIQKAEQLQSIVLTGDSVPTISESAKSAVNRVNEVLSLHSEGRGDQIKNYQDAELEEESQKCKVLEENAAALPKNSVVTFNLARCAQSSGRYDEANSFFAEYLKLAADPLDGPEVRLELKDIEPLLALRGGQARAIRQLYAEAYRMIMVRKFDRAIDTYKKAKELYPTFQETNLKLGLIYEASGNLTLARRYLDEYIALEPNKQATKAASDLLTSLDERSNAFYAYLEKGKKLAMAGALSSAQTELSEAALIFPLSPELNTLLAYVALKGNNPQVARRAFDVAWSFGFPVSFYAHVIEDQPDRIGKTGLIEGSMHNQHMIRSARLAKVEIERDDFRLVFLSVPPPSSRRRRKAEPQVQSAPSVTAVSDIVGTLPDDKLGNILGSSRRLVPESAREIKVVPRDFIKTIRTAGGSVFVDLDGRIKVHIAPGINEKIQLSIRMIPEVPFAVPESGWPARKFANDYSRLFSQYLGIDEVELGAEHMTKVEKAEIVGEMAMVALSGVGAAANAPSMFAKVLNSVSAATAAYARLQQAVLQQRSEAQKLDFKFIPVEPVRFLFSTDQFR